MRLMVFAVCLAAFAGPAVAQQMNADVFYQRANKLKAKGALAVFSGGEIKALMREGQAAGKASGLKHKADKAAGRPPRFCAPPGPQKMGSDEFMTRLGAIPPAERRRIDMTEATTRILAAKFPCRG
jgi:hypothetical protein